MGVHADDTALGGEGTLLNSSIAQLKQRFQYRKWREAEGEFCGAWYKQSPSGETMVNMSSFADKMRCVNIPKGSSPETPLTDAQIRVLRAVNGNLNWLASQSRPDLSAQTSFSQQAFLQPKIQDFRGANQAVRAVQSRNVTWEFVLLRFRCQGLLLFAIPMRLGLM